MMKTTDTPEKRGIEDTEYFISRVVASERTTLSIYYAEATEGLHLPLEVVRAQTLEPKNIADALLSIIAGGDLSKPVEQVTEIEPVTTEGIRNRFTRFTESGTPIAVIIVDNAPVEIRQLIEEIGKEAAPKPNDPSGLFGDLLVRPGEQQPDEPVLYTGQYL